ncbi:molecular chaperone HtpG [Anoxybacterium hadale]|uniref:Molecular chaperone HtpG n=1 Tax=Anoxybacterium hadale TaxID=3408580 RepID=A0ACD1AE61_9FIRM|nr:molecular chaperone HtpG [Clostridiales bacterium]
MSEQSGFLSIESKNIFTILKKWLYTEQDIVFRELISNAADAVEKFSSLQQDEVDGRGAVRDARDAYSEGKYLAEKYAGEISVTLDAEKNRIIISDNGIGMTRDEIDRYINQIAFSGAADFIQHYNEDQKNKIIGHFGVGFYSAFMIADHVAIETRSWQNGASSVRWDCRSDMSYQTTEGTRAEHGTDVILYLNESHPYVNQEGTLKADAVYEIIKKYFAFLKTKIYLDGPDFDHILVNDPDPIWKKPEHEIQSEDMKQFYKEFYDDISDPLFWIQFESADIGVKGIIFFRNTKNQTEELDGCFRIYNQGVYIGENIKELVPRFVNLQSGIIECTDLPMVVSRANIRGEEQINDVISLIYECLSQEVTIGLNHLFESKRQEYEAYWPHLNAFVKYGILQDKIFASVMTRKVVFEDLYGGHLTIGEYLQGDRIAPNADLRETHDIDAGGAKEQITVYYASDAIEQAHYIRIFKQCGLNALLFDHVIDQPFLRRQELVHPGTKFIRIDSDMEALLQGSLTPEDEADAALLTKKIQNAVGERLGRLELKVSKLEQRGITTLILHDEKSRRMADMLEIYGMLGAGDVSAKEAQSKSTLLVNLNNDILQHVAHTEDEAQAYLILNQLFDLALMSQGAMNTDYVGDFIARSEAIIGQYIQR